MIQPDFLKRGDTVAIVSTARFITEPELEYAIEKIRSWGLKVQLGPHVYARSDQFGGTDEQRRSDFQWALDDDNIQAIICSRGGYGSVRILDHLNFERFVKQPKWICGYSDITVLHNHINENFNIQTIHSTMPISFKTNSEGAVNSLRDALFGEITEYDLRSSEVFRAKEVSGEMVGGNLSLVYSTMGSSSQLNTKGKLLFLEDLDEMLYHLDRMIINLDRAGLFAGLNALVLGGFSDMRDNTSEFGFKTHNPYGKNAREIFMERLSAYDFPIVWGFPSGHINNNLAWYCGAEHRLALSGNEPKMILKGSL